MEEGKGGCFAIIIVLFVVGVIVSSCNSLFGHHDDSDFISKAHDAVQEKLKSPSTSSFCDNDIVKDSPKTDSNGDKIVLGCVNAQNSFGATVEVDYAVYEDKDTNVLDAELKDRQ